MESKYLFYILVRQYVLFLNKVGMRCNENFRKIYFFSSLLDLCIEYSFKDGIWSQAILVILSVPAALNIK